MIYTCSERVGKAALELEELARWLRAWRGIQGRVNYLVKSIEACQAPRIYH